MGVPVTVDSDDLRRVLEGCERMYQGGPFEPITEFNRLAAIVSATCPACNHRHEPSGGLCSQCAERGVG